MADTNAQLKKLTEAIEKLVAKEVLPVAPVAPVLPIAPIAPTNSLDHDLLQRLDTKVDQIQSDVTALKNQGSQYVNQTEHREVCKAQEDHEKRIRNLEKYVWLAMGAIIIVEFALKFFVK